MTPQSMASNATMKSSTDDDKCMSAPLYWTLLIVGIILGVLVILWIIRKFVQGPFYRKKNRIDGKVVIITGCNSGIGKETALELAKRGARVYMACRDPVRCENARIEIVEKSKNENVFNRTLDIGSLESVRKFAAEFIAEESRLDILINNAGIMGLPKGLTKDGFELILGTNHLGHFLLTNLLLDTLKNSTPSRIVVVSSALYAFATIKKDDLNSDKSYTPFSAYTQSKLANALFTVKLSEKLHGTGVTVNCLHPGVVRTDIGRNMFSDGILTTMMSPLTWFFLKTPIAGAQTTVKLALDPALEKSTGGYYSDSIRIPLLPKARNKEMAEWLWTVSEKMVGLRSTDKTTIIELEKLPTQNIPGNINVSDRNLPIMEGEPENINNRENIQTFERVDEIKKNDK